MSLKKNKTANRTHFTTNEGIVVVKTESTGPTLFPEKHARANEILKKAKLLPPLTKK
jgi:hypothetical protein